MLWWSVIPFRLRKHDWNGKDFYLISGHIVNFKTLREKRSRRSETARLLCVGNSSPHHPPPAFLVVQYAKSLGKSLHKVKVWKRTRWQLKYSKNTARIQFKQDHNMFADQKITSTDCSALAGTRLYDCSDFAYERPRAITDSLVVAHLVILYKLQRFIIPYHKTTANVTMPKKHSLNKLKHEEMANYFSFSSPTLKFRTYHITPITPTVKRMQI